ncbi:tyrosine-type recombinase/integrase [Clostridium sp. Marseille-P299]|uniref:tyrosine-type recombinase/integrase n=1 Tax=Clostridium sp. Marseille-P299 TaxID=1805477 RepID=UPI0008344FD1|nr:tyrosine-type recombinase/integrase [Clostridium sp. Marseille-P299]
MASIRKRGNSYQITVSNGRDSSGRQILETTTFTPDHNLTERQQKKALDTFVFEFEQKVKSGKLLKGEKLTLSEFTDQWLKEYAKINLTQNSFKSYSDNLKLRIIPALGHIKLSNLNPMHLQSYYNNLLEDGIRLDGKPGGYSAATIKKDHVILSSILHTAVQWQLIENNPCDRVSPPKVTRTAENIKFFTLEQTQLFLNALDMNYSFTYQEHDRIDDTGKKYHVSSYEETKRIPKQFKVFFYIAIFGGLRRGEIVALTWEDINFDECSVNISKSSSYVNKQIITKEPKTLTSIRTIKLPGFVIQLLKEWKLEQNKYRLSLGDQWVGSNHIFTQWNGKQMYPSTPTQTFKKIINKYNKTVTDEKDKLPLIPLHGLRHTSATLLIAENVDVKTVSTRLGHAQTSTTMDIYAHALKQLDEKAASALEDAFKKKA